MVEVSRPMYTIGVVSEVVDVHPETLRIWDRRRLVHPERRSRRRLYSETDLKRLGFIKGLIGEGLNLASVGHFLGLYPCWDHEECPPCMSPSDRVACAKPCWKEDGLYCGISFDQSNPCSGCWVQEPECRAG